MKYKKIILFLLGVFILLLTIDLVTGVWFWNRNYLEFSSQLFNNILTPIISLIAVIIYSFALYQSIKQNKIMHSQYRILFSQNIKPYYEKEIEFLLTKAEGLTIKNLTLELGQTSFNALNYTSGIYSAISLLIYNQEFQEDVKSYKDGNKFKYDYLEKRSYYNCFLFLTQYLTIMNPIDSFYSESKSLIEEIKLSNLLSEDKTMLKKRINRLLIKPYLDLVLFFNSNKNFIFPIYNPLKPEIEFKPFSETAFTKHFDWFQKNLND
jgi:hypothetical protein